MSLTYEEKQTVADIINIFYNNAFPLNFEPGIDPYHEHPNFEKKYILVTSEMVTDETVHPVRGMMSLAARCSRNNRRHPVIEITDEDLNKLLLELEDFSGASRAEIEYQNEEIKIINTISQKKLLGAIKKWFEKLNNLAGFYADGFLIECHAPIRNSLEGIW